MPRPDVEGIASQLAHVEQCTCGEYPVEAFPALLDYVRELEAALEVRQQCPICNAHACIDQETGAVITAPR